MNVVLFVLFFLYFKSHPFLSRNVDGGVRQTQHSSLIRHCQRPVATNSGKEINTFVALHPRMDSATTEDSNTSQYKFANVSL